MTSFLAFCMCLVVLMLAAVFRRQARMVQSLRAQLAALDHLLRAVRLQAEQQEEVEREQGALQQQLLNLAQLHEQLTLWIDHADRLSTPKPPHSPQPRKLH